MRKRLALLIVLISFTVLYPQNLKLGVTGNFLTKNNLVNYQVGPEIHLNYDVNNLPVSVQGSLRFYISELSGGNNFSTGYNYYNYSAGIQLNYYPVKWAVEPYIGAGVFYNINKLSQSGTPSPSIDGKIYSPDKIKNNVSAEIMAGLKFSALNPINFIVEVSQSFNKPGYELITQDIYNNKTIKEDSELNFNSLFIKIGLLFSI